MAKPKVSDNPVIASVAKELITRELEQVPEAYIGEILDFIRFLKAKNGSIAIALASESSLGKDWLRPEEDDAWRSL
ncbi:MAG: DUF2281 domain-containing protein [Nitrospirae bacterium]|nr:DUF2281 domain-containing protein [Nitrospirota bacterium]